MNSLDKQMEELIIRVNSQSEIIKSYRELTNDLKQTIKELRDEQRRNKEVSKGD